MKTFYILSFLLLTIIQPANASGPVGGPYTCDDTTTSTVEDGSPVSINWNVANAVTCTAGFASGIAYPISPNDGIYTAWYNSSRGGVTGASLGTANTAPGTYTFTCREPSSLNIMGCAQLTVTCTAPKVWNGTTCAIPAVACNLPWGGTIASGASVTAYGTSSVPFGNVCTSETRTCTNGTLSGSYTSSSCVVDPAVSCVLPWGGALAHGASVTAYQSASVISPAVCTSESRSCTNGTLNGSYTNSSCSVTITDCTLPWGGTTTDGSTVTAYSSSYIASPGLCSSLAETRSCTATVLSGSNTNETCLEGSASFTSTPACSIASGGASGCNTTLGWTSANAGTVSLTDCGGGLYNTYPTGAQSGSVYVPYNAGCYQIRDAFNNILAEANPVNSDCTPGAIWDPLLSQCRLPIGGTLSANPQVCNIDPNAPSCDSTFTWTTTNPIGVSQVVGDGGGPFSAISNALTQLLTVNFSGQTFRLYNNGEELASTTITQVCLNGANNPPLCNAGGSMMTATFNANPTSCLIPAGQGTCPITLDWNVTLPTGATTAVTRDGTPGNLYTGHSNPGQIENVPYEADGTVVYRLYNNSIEIAPPGLSIGVGCAGGPTKWDTLNKLCSDPQVGSAKINGDYGYPTTPPASTSSVEFSCIGSDRYEVRKTPAGANTLFASALLPAPNYSGLIDVPVTLTDNYAVICKQGTIESTPEVRFFSAPPPPVATLSINATPKTIDIGGKTTLSWSIQWTLPTCTLTASPVCANNICSQSQLDAATALMTTITTGSTDANDPSGPNRSITSAIRSAAPGHELDQKAMGKRTFDVIHSTNFTIDCGGTNKASTIVRVTNNNEQ